VTPADNRSVGEEMRKTGTTAERLTSACTGPSCSLHPDPEVQGERRESGARGSVLVVTLLLVSALSVLMMMAADTVLLAHRVQQAFESSWKGFYVAEAGLAHARFLCSSLEPDGGGLEADPADPVPWGRWVPFGDGAYYLTAQFLKDAPAGAPLSSMQTGFLVEVSARVGTCRETRIKMLLEDPPSCRTVAWWQTRN